MQKYDYLVSGTVSGYPFTWTVTATDETEAKSIALADLEQNLGGKVVIEKVEIKSKVLSEV